MGGRRADRREPQAALRTRGLRAGLSDRRSPTGRSSSTRCRASTSRTRRAVRAGTTPAFGIQWPPAEARIISERDTAWPLSQAESSWARSPEMGAQSCKDTYAGRGLAHDRVVTLAEPTAADRRCGGCAVLVILATRGPSAVRVPRTPTTLLITPSTSTVAPGERLHLRAYLRRPDGSSDDISGSVRWRSSRARVLAVGRNGHAVGRRAGTAAVRARLHGRVGTARVTVARASRALRVDRSNPRYFADAAGNPVYLAGAHTWSDVVDNGVSDPPPRFNYRRYLDVLQGHDLNLIRLWAWEQAHWTAEIKGDYSFLPTVYERPGPGVALDGKPRVRSDQVQRRIFRASSTTGRGCPRTGHLRDGHVVRRLEPGTEGTRASTIRWRGHPFNVRNNVNGIDGDPEGSG